MSNPDPADPLPVFRAIRDLANRWEADTGEGGDVNGNSHRTLIWEMSEAQLKVRYGTFVDAALHVFRHAIVSLKIRVWVENGADWKRPTLNTILSRLPPASGLYVDLEEVRRVLGARWPRGYPTVLGEAGTSNDGTRLGESLAAGVKGKASGSAAKPKVGRPRGRGYSLKDIPVFQMILNAQRETGDVESQHGLVKKFAGEADGASFDANVDRLRPGLPRWLEENGHQWRPPIKAKLVRGE